MSHRNAIIRLHADNIEAAAQWYSDVLAIEPISIGPDAVEFWLDDIHELEISRGAPSTGEPACWHCDDVDAAVEQLVALGARECRPRETLNGEVHVSLMDPFGNLLEVA